MMADQNLQVENYNRPKDEPEHTWDILAMFLLLAAMLTAASRLEATHWAKPLAIIPTLAILGTIAGLALGGSRFKSWIGAIFCLAYGVYLICWQFGLTATNNLPWKERLLDFGRQAILVLSQLGKSQPASDSILFILSMAVLFWIITFAAGYTLIRRGNAWLAVLPMGLAIFTIHSFDPLVVRRGLYLALYLFFSLVLVARAAYLHNRDKWEKSHTILPHHHELDFIRSALITGALIIVVGWSIPAITRAIPVVAKATQPLRHTWTDLRSRWENAFHSLTSTGTIYSEYFGPVLALGRGTALGESSMFSVKPADSMPSSTRVYWRAMAYNQYQAGQWGNQAYTNQVFDPNSPLDITEYLGRWPGNFEITPTTHVTTLYTPAQPVSVSLKSQVKLANNPDGSVDIAGFEADPPLRPGQSYQASASMSNATIKQLRTSGVDYPTWVTERYLQLPDSLTPRTLQLAKEITAGLENPYDQAAAITNYLRDHIEYQETIPAAPRGRDLIDWFLFDYKKGFCNYYATSEVIMLRSLGIPARLAAGYAQGERREDGSYLVRQRDAHAWPEAYFPNAGWVEFEPTTSQPEIIRLSGEASSSAPFDEAQAELALLKRQELEDMARQHQNLPIVPLPTSPSFWPLFFTLLAIALAAVAAFLIIRINQGRLNPARIPVMLETAFLKLGLKTPTFIKIWSWRAGQPALTTAYHEINRALARLGAPAQPPFTPAERAQELAKILPPAGESAQRLVAEYEIDTFSTKNGDYNKGKQESRIIRRLSIWASIPRIMKRFRNFLAFKRPGK
jgi:transglutaminase-like putative cysteine protease